MQGHGIRTAYHIVGEGAVFDPDYLSADGQTCPVSSAPAGKSACPPFKFGRMFPRPERLSTARDWDDTIKGLIQLGLCMNDPAKYCKGTPVQTPGNSLIPAGFTYLGQFIAHEITFDNSKDLPTAEPDPQNVRSPSIDLDSLYGAGPHDEQSRQLYEEGSPARLKVGQTASPDGLTVTFDNDLPRDWQTGRALIGDERNDENLVIAQTTVALIKFHNKVVEALRQSGYDADDLFECARKQVIRHFQWMILHDYLPTIVDKDVLDCVLRHGLRWFKVARRKDLFMPLEFSGAAFRIGHSMVRRAYQWNLFHSTDLGGPSGATLSQLFDQTAFSGLIGKPLNQTALASDWVIDWSRFYEFPKFPAGRNYKRDPARINMARKIDTNFDFRLDQMSNFPHLKVSDEKKSITVRNLLRGFALGLPTGEEVAGWIGETPLRHDEVAGGPHEELLSAPVFKGRTPLWYYILKEAELNGGSRLGRVGSRIIAETLVGLISHSRYSVLDAPRWYPKYTRRGVPGTESARFGMVDLLDFAGVVNPIEGQ
jgi:hypothetical protein